MTSSSIIPGYIEETQIYDKQVRIAHYVSTPFVRVHDLVA
jgi:hypothetical protein